MELNRRIPFSRIPFSKQINGRSSQLRCRDITIHASEKYVTSAIEPRFRD